MRSRSTKLLAIVIAAFGIATLPGCTTAIRVCTVCTYKSKVTFNNLPTGTITSAQMTVKVTHSGACPQSPGFPPNCTEVKVYDVKCKLGTSRTLNVPFFIDAAPSVTSHSATITVVKSGATTTHTGVVDLTSNVPGGGAPPTALMPTPCPPPTLSPYSPFPAVQ